MALSSDEQMKLEIIFEGAKEFFDELTEWEQGFVVSTEERYNQYKDGTRVSAKQWGILDRIYDKVVND
jgi:hypothetical protein